MIRKILIASTALAAIAAFTIITEPVHAGSSCVLLAAKGRGIDDANASNRSVKHLTNKINHYAHKNKLGSVRVGPDLRHAPRRPASSVQELGQSLRLAPARFGLRRRGG